MKGPAILIAIGVLCVGTAVAAAQSDKDMQPVSQTTQAQNATNGPLDSGSPIHVALTKTIDSNKVKQGDTVTARTVQPTKANGKTVIPSGAIVEGHITQASSREKGDSFSTVGIVFDKATLKNGERVPLNVTVQAIALPQTSVTGAPNPGTDTAPLGEGAPQGGADRPAGRPAAMPPSTPSVPDTAGNVATNSGTNSAHGPNAGLNDNGQLLDNSRGVYGLRGIGLAMQANGNEQAAVITSTAKEVHLSSGTQLLLVTQPGPTQVSKY
jgi:hypothetical protein